MTSLTIGEWEFKGHELCEEAREPGDEASKSPLPGDLVIPESGLGKT